MARSKRALSSLTENKLKGGRRYWTNYYGEVVQIECACCHKVKPANAFHTNNFKKFNKQNYCIACNDERLYGKPADRVREARPEPVLATRDVKKETRKETVRDNIETLTERQRALLGQCLQEGRGAKEVDEAIADLHKVKKWLQIVK